MLFLACARSDFDYLTAKYQPNGDLQIRLGDLYRTVLTVVPSDSLPNLANELNCGKSFSVYYPGQSTLHINQLGNLYITIDGVTIYLSNKDRDTLIRYLFENLTVNKN